MKSSLFGVSTKKPRRAPKDLALKSHQCLERVINKCPLEKDQESLAKYFQETRAILHGDGTHDLDPKMIQELVEECVKQSIPWMISQGLPMLEFEARKDAAATYNGLARAKDLETGRYKVAEELSERNDGEELEGLILGYEKQSSALAYGAMLREVVRHEKVLEKVLRRESFLKFFEYMQCENFEIASDAMASFRECLTRHKDIVARFLIGDAYEGFFEKFNDLLEQGNYVCKRQSLKLLGEILLDRASGEVMMKYISKAENLCLMMNLLRDDAKSIQYEAFHVFKVFVANPNRLPAVTSILEANKEKLMHYLSKFHEERDKDDAQFAEERQTLIDVLQGI